MINGDPKSRIFTPNHTQWYETFEITIFSLQFHQNYKFSPTSKVMISPRQPFQNYHSTPPNGKKYI